MPSVDRTFVLNPELAQFVPDAVFMPYASVDLASLDPMPPQTTGPITIVHAPTDPTIKGSRYIIAAVERLKQRHQINFVLVEGMPHAEAMKAYRSADLVIDQVLAGWYGGLAVEVMAMAKPVACYLRHEDFDVLPEGMCAQLPLVNITPETIESAIEAFITQRESWPEWGRRSREYVLRWHNPETIARAMKRAYEDPQSRFDLAP
ncbi:MAG: glycosyltransferase [Pyrinomonadaceae bacterium]